MAQIKEITTLNTVASVRKAAQQSMRPVIDEIETKMKCLSRDMQELSASTKQIFEFEKKLKKTQEQNQYLQKQLMQVRESNQMMQCQMISDRARLMAIEQNMREQLRRFFREKEKQDLAVQSINDRNIQIQKEMTDNLKSIRDRQGQMEIRFRNLSQKSEKFSKQVKNNATSLKEEFDSMKAILNHQVKESSRRLELLDMYETQREFINKELTSINQTMDTLVSQENMQVFKVDTAKQQNKFAESIRDFMAKNFTQQTRQLIAAVPQIKVQLSKCLTFQETIDRSTVRIAELNTHIKNIQDRYEKQRIKSKRQQSIRFQDIRKQHEKMEQNIQKALSLEGLIQNKMDEYSDQLKAELRLESQKKSKELYNQIKLMFADTRQAMREKELKNIIEERKKLSERCVEIEKLGGKIGQVLSNFSTKITMMKSDNELFVGQVKKELSKLIQLQNHIAQNNEDIGQFLSQITESIIAQYCIHINENSNHAEEILFTTKKDGVIYQKFGNCFSKDKMTYRRKEVETKVLRKAMVFALLQGYDKLMHESSCLKWAKNSPSSFFKNDIQPIYHNLVQKNDPLEHQQDFKTERIKESIDFSTIQARQTASTSYERINRSRNFSNRKSKIERYTQQENGDIFAHKSARRVRIHLNSSLGIS